MKYRPEIDGLRAIAVIPVILFHAGAPLITGGFVGVDIFFVISGFLITTILFEELERGQFSIIRFYERRARRILPALTFVIVCTLPFVWAWMLPSQLESYGASLISVAAFVSNVFFWRESGYFDASAEIKPMLHTWSLAVEEQYYIFFPLVLWVVWKIDRRWVFPSLVIATFASLCLAVWVTGVAPSASFYLAPTRFWEILVGAICSILIRFYRLPKIELGGLIGIALIAAAIAFFTPSTPTPSLWTLVPVGGTALVILFATPGTKTAWLLSSKPLVAIGLVSYSAYLWHQPLLALVRIKLLDEPSVTTSFVVVLATFALAGFSWRFIERPFRKPIPLGPSRRTVFRLSAAAITSTMIIGAAFFWLKGADWRSAPNGEPFSKFAEIEARLKPNRGLNEACDDRQVALSNTCQTGSKPTVVLWGDSYAMHLVQALQYSPTHADFVQLTLSSCGPFPGLSLDRSVLPWRDCIAFNEGVLDWISRNTAISTVIVSAAFSPFEFKTLDRWGSKVPSDQIKRRLVDSLLETSALLAASGKKLVIIGPPARNGQDLGLCYMRQVMAGAAPENCDFAIESSSSVNKAISEVLQSVEGQIPIVRLDDLTCSSGHCLTMLDSVNIYRDGGHLSVLGSKELGVRFDLMGISLAKVPGPI